MTRGPTVERAEAHAEGVAPSKRDTENMDDIGRRIEAILRRELEPVHLEIRDDSDRHVGHPGATSGGGHYRVTVVSARFEGLSRIEQHREVHRALEGLIGREIHALGLRTSTPDEWSSRTGAGR